MRRKNVFYFINVVVLCVVFFPHIASASTFPENDAGISAYTNSDDINESNNLTKLNNAVAFFEEVGEVIANDEETHVIGKIPVEVIVEDVGTGGDAYIFSISPYVYVDIEGWIVAYLGRYTPASKIVHWNSYEPGQLKSNVLEDAIDMISDELGISQSTPEYYHFRYPDANRMTIIIDTVYNPDISETDPPTNNFSVTIPGEIYESSYSVYYSHKLSSGSCITKLKVDSEIVHEKSSYWCRDGDEFEYDFYPDNIFSPNIAHSVVFEGKGGSTSMEIRLGAATVLIYEN